MQFIDGVDIPEEVLRAHSSGKLVLFVGAGASKSDPSSLPLFDELALQLGARAREPFDDAYRDKIDRYIGSLPSGFDAHRHAAEILQPEGSAPNDVHRALVSLASCAGVARIVTTNFDNHLSSVATELGIDLGGQWIGPALPLGRDFRGIVHLHGSLTRHHDELILNDRDFGRAYFGDGWAPRFLQPMFSNHVVLFVGYSLTDTVMRYLTLGLPSKTSRYALVPQSDIDTGDLSRLQVTAIPYPNGDGRHLELPRVLNAWARWKRMGEGEHAERITSLISTWEAQGGSEHEPLFPELSIVDEDYLYAQIATVDGARTFVNRATSVKWLEWSDRLPDFEAIFASMSDLSEVSLILADWFASRFVAIPTQSGAAMAAVRRHLQRLHPALIRKLAFAVHQLEEVDSVAAQKWRAILATSIHGHSAPNPIDPLLSFRTQANTPHSAVVRKALTPYLNLGSGFSLLWREDNDWPRAEIAWPLDAHDMKEQIGAWLEAETSAADTGLFMLETALLAAYEMLDAYNGGTTRGALEWGRSAIEPHTQDEHVESIDIVIDGLRDLGAQIRGMSPPLHERWWGYEFGLFRRLALHFVATSEDLTSDEKINWVLDRQLLFDLLTKHETFQVLQKAIPEATSAVRARLLEMVLAGSPAHHETGARERTRTYEIFNLLVWLTRAAPDWERASVEFTRLQTENPDFAEREHPDFSMWHESGSWTSEPVVPVAEFGAQVEADPVAALNLLSNVSDGDSHRSDDFFREDYALVRGLAAEHPQKGLALWDAVDSSGRSEEDRTGFHTALIYGWTKAELDEIESDVLRRVTALAGEEGSLYTVTEFLLEQVRKRADGADSEFLESARLLSLSIWEEHQHSFQPHDGSAPSSLALNTWPGDLVHFWIAQIQRRWREAGGGWSGLNGQESTALKELLEGPRSALQAIWPAVGSELYFFDAADPVFTDMHILPLFSGEESLRHVWEPFLFHPRVSLRLLRAGLLESIVSNFRRLSTLDLSHLEGQFKSLAASIVSFAAIEEDERQQILESAVIADNGIHAASFAGAVADLLRDDPTHAQVVWKSWLQRHLVQRFEGVPRDAATAEMAQWAEIIPALGEHIAGAVALFLGRGIGLGEGRFSREFPEGALTNFGPELVAYFTERVQSSEPTDMIVAYRVRELVESIRDSVGDFIAKPLIDVASERGFLDRRALG